MSRWFRRGQQSEWNQEWQVKKKWLFLLHLDEVEFSSAPLKFCHACNKCSDLSNKHPTRRWPCHITSLKGFGISVMGIWISTSLDKTDLPRKALNRPFAMMQSSSKPSGVREKQSNWSRFFLVLQHPAVGEIVCIFFVHLRFEVKTRSGQLCIFSISYVLLPSPFREKIASSIWNCRTPLLHFDTSQPLSSFNILQDHTLSAGSFWYRFYSSKRLSWELSLSPGLFLSDFLSFPHLQIPVASGRWMGINIGSRKQTFYSLALTAVPQQP